MKDIYPHLDLGYRGTSEEKYQWGGGSLVSAPQMPSADNSVESGDDIDGLDDREREPEEHR